MIVKILLDLVKLRLDMGFLTLLLILVSLSIFEIALAYSHTFLIALDLILNAFEPGLSIFQVLPSTSQILVQCDLLVLNFAATLKNADVLLCCSNLLLLLLQVLRI